MRKTRIYLDSSVASMLDDSERGKITKKFFEMIIREPNNFEIVISPVLKEEIDAMPDIEAVKKIYARLKLLPVINVKENEEAENLAWIYVIEGVLQITTLTIYGTSHTR